METTLIFEQGMELPEFASFPLVETEEGRAALRAYFEPYLAIARERGIGILLDAPTWRANPDWGAKLGYSLEQLEEANRAAVAFMDGLRGEADVLVSGCVGPRGDGYVPGELMTAAEAEDYHGWQVADLRRHERGARERADDELRRGGARDRARGGHGRPALRRLVHGRDGRAATERAAVAARRSSRSTRRQAAPPPTS